MAYVFAMYIRIANWLVHLIIILHGILHGDELAT